MKGQQLGKRDIRIVNTKSTQRNYMSRIILYKFLAFGRVRFTRASCGHTNQPTHLPLVCLLIIFLCYLCIIEHNFFFFYSTMSSDTCCLKCSADIHHWNVNTERKKNPIARKTNFWEREKNDEFTYKMKLWFLIHHSFDGIYCDSIAIISRLIRDWNVRFLSSEKRYNYADIVNDL